MKPYGFHHPAAKVYGNGSTIDEPACPVLSSDCTAAVLGAPWVFYPKLGFPAWEGNNTSPFTGYESRRAIGNRANQTHEQSCRAFSKSLRYACSRGRTAADGKPANNITAVTKPVNASINVPAFPLDLYLLPLETFKHSCKEQKQPGRPGSTSKAVMTVPDCRLHLQPGGALLLAPLRLSRI